jgi:hypothetical protein
MNQKEYELIAGVFYDAMIQLSTVKQADEWRSLVFKMADALEAYPSFTRNKFLAACGVTI